MLDREKINNILDAMDKLSDEDVTLQIQGSGNMDLRVYPKNWWASGNKWPDEKRHQILALLTPFVGKLSKEVNGTNIGYRGEIPGLSIRLNYVDSCKVVGYKTVKKTVRKEVEREPVYEEEEVEEQIAITDCAIREGKFSEEDIEVRA